MTLVTIGTADEKGGVALTATCTQEAYEKLYKPRGYGLVNADGTDFDESPAKKPTGGDTATSPQIGA